MTAVLGTSQKRSSSSTRYGVPKHSELEPDDGVSPTDGGIAQDRRFGRLAYVSSAVPKAAGFPTFQIPLRLRTGGCGWLSTTS
jgi:hypothetical protein